TASNDVGTLAASMTAANQSFSYTDASGVTIGTVGAVTGLTTTGTGGVTITALNGDIVQNAAVSVATGGTATLSAASGAVQQTGGTMKAGFLAVTARDSSSLTLAGNDIATLAASVTGIGGSGGSFSYIDSNALTVGSAGGLN